MENLDDKPLPLRGPSLPGSLGVRVRGDWESFGEEHEGIQMRSSLEEDVNVKLDFMKEENHDVGVRGDLERFEEGSQGAEMRGCDREESNAQLDSTNGDDRASSERDLDETGRKFPLNMQTTKIGQPDSRVGVIDSGQVSQAEALCVIPPAPQYDDCTEQQSSHNETQDIQSVLSLNDESFGTSSSFWRGASESESSDPIHPLPNGKKYHVFFSYDMEDRDWVHSVADKMESELGYRCSFHERDFHGGKRVIENIMEHIQWSVKTVLVLSPDFLESSWCQYEMKQGLHASIEEARMLIVPVMVRECEVPDTLRSLTYIDATPGADWWGRFLEAVAAEDHLQIINADKNQMSIQPRYENLELLCEVSSFFQCCFGEKFVVPYTPEILKKSGIEVPDGEFHIATSLVKQAHDPNCLNRILHDYIPTFCVFTTLCCLLLIACTIASLIIYILPFLLGQTDQMDASVTYHGRTKGTFMIITPLFGLVVYIVSFRLQIKKRKAAIRKATVNMNRILLQFKVLSGVSTSSLGNCSSLRTKMLFYYFDVNQCENHLKEYIAGLEDTICPEEYSKALVINFSEEYTRDYKEGKLMYKVGFVTRHVRHVKCLCQYIEERLNQEKNLKEFCEKKVNLAPEEIV